jgi:hypothetical protein
VIRCAPFVPEPYITLGMIYTDTNQPQLALRFKVRATRERHAHLCLPRMQFSSDSLIALDSLRLPSSHSPSLTRAQLLAALSQSEADVDWHELGLLSRQQGELTQALYCFDKALRFSRDTVRR